MHTREYFASVKDQKYFGHGVLIEFGYAHNDFFQTQSPQGPNLYVISPEGNSGNYFLNSTQAATRDQGLIHAYLPKFQVGRLRIRFEVGADADWLHYTGDFSRTGYEVLGLSGQLISETLFPSPARFHVDDTEMSAYLLDTWRVSKRLQFNLGIREDWDTKNRRLWHGPRARRFPGLLSHRAAPRISGGYSLTHDAVTMDMLGWPLDQTAVTTLYNPNGTPAGPPGAHDRSPSATAALVLPRAEQLDARCRSSTVRARLCDGEISAAAWDGWVRFHQYAGSGCAAVAAAFAQRGRGGNLPAHQSSPRRLSTRSQFSVRQTFSGQYEWMASYTRSRALSNAVLDPNIAQPLQVLPNLVPMPWDAPNRFLGWAYLPLPWKNWAISVLADMRTGFPFSVRDQSGVIVGRRRFVSLSR